MAPCSAVAACTHSLTDTLTSAALLIAPYRWLLPPKGRIIFQINRLCDKSDVPLTDKADLGVCEIIGEAWWDVFEADVCRAFIA